MYINSEAVTVTNQIFNLSASYEKLKNILDWPRFRVDS